FAFSPSVGIIGHGQYFSLCGMNVAFKPEVAAAMYFAPSGPAYPYDRFDDIWLGIIAKRVFDHLRLYCHTGYPQIIHSRASDPFINLKKEAPGIATNEGFWHYIDELDLHGHQDIRSCVRVIARHMAEQPYQDEAYFR